MIVRVSSEIACLAALLAIGLAGCAHGNVRSQASIHGPKPPTVLHPLYDPYASYGSAPAAWRPALATRAGTIVKPTDPADQADRPAYEQAKWSVETLASKSGTW
jgi:hypothetical protein